MNSSTLAYLGRRVRLRASYSRGAWLWKSYFSGGIDIQVPQEKRVTQVWSQDGGCL
jgi:hypothetical protein